MPQVRALWRHPIKGHGREAMASVELQEGQTIPWDRRWAVAHAGAQTDGKAWAPCVNYSRGSKAPALMAIDASCDEVAGTVTLRHPDRPDLTFDPDSEVVAFLDWVRPLMPENRAQSASIHRVPERGMTDTDYPSVSLINLASHADLEARMGTEISALRWRCNFHFDGFAPWEELGWEGRTLRIGNAELTVREPIERCLATAANPATGSRDLDTLGALNSDFGHQDFGIYAMVTQAGRIKLGDEVTLL